MTEVTLHFDGDPVVERKDFYRAKLDKRMVAFVLLEYDERQNSSREDKTLI